MNSALTLKVTTEITQSHVITVLANGEPIGTIDLRRFMPRHKRIRLALGHRISSFLARYTPWAG